VIDTNVVVSGLLSPAGNEALILLANGVFQPAKVAVHTPESTSLAEPRGGSDHVVQAAFKDAPSGISL
jgi:hypothetical protein